VHDTVILMSPSDRTSLARHVPQLVSQNLQTDEYIALMSDGWTNDYRKVAYVIVLADFSDDNLDLLSCILDTSAVHKFQAQCNLICKFIFDDNPGFNGILVH